VGTFRYGIFRAGFWVAAALAASLLALGFAVPVDAGGDGDGGFAAGKKAYEASDYAKASQLLTEAAAAQPQNGDIQLLLTKTHLELLQYEAAIKSAERAVAIDGKNSVYHEWLGHAYGEKADHSGFMSALGFAKKTRKEFATAVELDGKNLAARQSLVEYDCAAPSMAGGGEDKAQPEIAEIAKLDAAEGHYAAGNCHRQKKDFPGATAEFEKALAGHLKSDERVFDIGDYAMRQREESLLLSVADWGAKVAPADARAGFYRAVALVVQKKDAANAERLLREYLKNAPTRSGYPRLAMAHYWLGQLAENDGNEGAARGEYETAVKMDPKNKLAQEALKKTKKG
jgi:tetratricopeptide (TPR) repeat protein